MKLLPFLATITVLLAACSPSGNEATTQAKESESRAPVIIADTVYTNGRIYTVNETQPWAEAVAIKHGKFTVIGTGQEVSAVIGDGTEVIDLKGKLVIPGLIDPHNHAFEDYHNRHFAFGIQDDSSPESILDEVKAYAQANPDEPWIIGGNFPSGMFPNDNPDRELLDSAVSDRPACLCDQSGHGWWCNTRALEITGILDGSARLPDGAIIERDAEGVPSGTVREHAIGFIRRSTPEIPLEEWIEVGRGFMQWFNSMGVTSIQLAAGNEIQLRAAQSLDETGELSVRLAIALNYGYFDSPESLEQEQEFTQRAHEYRTTFVDPSHVKIFMDGVPTAKTGWMVEPYNGTDDHGYGYYSPEELSELYIGLTGNGVAIMSHATGSRSVREVLNAIEAAQKAYPNSNVRHHVTHNGVIHPDDLGRFAPLGVAVDVAPTMPIPPALAEIARPLLGDERLRNYANPRAALDAGAVVAVGSDWQVSFMDPWRRIAFHVSRIDPENPDWGVLYPENALSVEEAVTAYTLGPAFAINKDSETGSIEVGKYADMIVLDRNLFEIDPLEIANTRVLTTVFAGRVVFKTEQ